MGLAASLPFAGPALAQTLPQGGNVVGGSGTIQQTAANQLTITQATQNLAINWNSFSIGAANVVRFVQPNTSAVALNRVLNGDPSQIYGQIQANGQVVIMSPNGIVFGPNSRVDVNALVATTANISTADFMAGKLLFDQASSDANARVVNQGVITVAQGGFAVLAAAGVANEGRILANGGTVVLGGTKTFAIDFHGDGLLKFAATGTVDQKPAGADALVENAGSIEANGGRVLMTARAARSVLDNVINTSGIVVAKSAQLVNGEIVIDGGDAGIVHVAGTLDASGAAAGERGGTVKVLGEKVGLFENARIDASGDAGGGTVLVGGNYQGNGPEANAQYLYMDARAVIDASSAAGDGGRVILWSDLATRNAGHIDVGGARDGGFVEVSSKGFLDFRGTVNLRGLAGRAGNLLLDPTDITITSGASSGDMAAGSPFAGSNATSNLDVAVLNAALTGGTVTVTTASAGAGTGNIDITAGIVNAANNTTLVLRADGAITIGSGGSINSGGYLLNVSLRAAGNMSVGGSGINTLGGYITTESTGGGGQAGGNFTSTANINAGGGNVTLAHAGTIAIGGTLNSSGLVSVNAGGATTQTAAITGSGALAVGGTGAVTLTHASNAFGSIALARTGTTSNVALLTSITPTLQTSTLGTGNFSLTGVGFTQSGAITQDAGGGAMTIDGGSGNVTLSQANSFTGAVDVSGSVVTVSAAQSAAGAGSLSLVATTKVVVNADLTTAGGNITLWGNAPGGTPGGSPSSGLNIGVNLQRTSAPSVTVDAGGGNISIAGGGGDGGTYSHGVLIDGVVVQTSGTGAIAIAGKGGASGAGAEQVGVYINGDTALSSVYSPGTALTSGSGGISIVGDGAATGSGGSNFGVRIVRATLTATGGGIAAVGTGGAGASSASIEVAGASLLATGAGGPVSLQGQTPIGTGTGILLRNSYDGAATTVEIGGASFLGNVVLQADTLANSATTLSISRQSGSGSVTFRTETDATTIGAAGGGGTLQVTSAILNAVSGFATQIVGSATQTGAINIGGTTGLTGSALGRNTSILSATATVALASDGNPLALGGYTLSVAGDGIVGQNGGITGGGTLELAGSGNVTLTSINNGFASLLLARTGAGSTTVSTTAGLTASGTWGTGNFSATADSVTLGGALSSTGGALDLFAARFVTIGNNIDTTGGNIAIAANVGGAGGGADFAGVFVNGATVESRGGNIDITGRGSASGTTVSGQHGIFLYNGGIVRSYTGVGDGTNGTVTLTGTGGSFAGTGNGGVALIGGGSLVASLDGNIAINGTGGTGGAGNSGLYLGGGVVRTDGAGSIAVTATGANGDSSRGIAVTGSGTGASGAIETTGTGSINLTGTGGATGIANSGVFLYATGTDYGVVRATGTGNVTVIGAGGAANQINQFGIIVEAAGSVISTASGNLYLDGTAGGGSASGILIQAGGALATTGGNLFATGAAGAGAGIAIDAASVSTAGAGNLTLDGTSGVLGLSGLNNASIATGTGTLLLVSSLDIFLDAAVLTTGGALDATATGVIALANFSNSIGGTTTVTATGSLANLYFRNTSANRDLAVTATGALELVDLEVTGNLTASAAGPLSVAESFIMAAGKNVALTATGAAAAIDISHNVTLSNGDFSAISARSIVATANVATNGGNILMYANAPGGDVNTGVATGAFHGVAIDGAVAVNAGGGNIDIRGRSGDSGTFHGVTVRNGAGVLTSGVGTVNIAGHGGTSATGGTTGVEFYAGGAYAQTQNGALAVTGTGGTGGGNNSGVALATGEIRATGTGTVDVTGTGGAGGSVGVSVQGGGATRIAAVDGDLTVVGTGGTGNGGGVESWGVNVAGQAGQGTIESMGLGDVFVTGTAGGTSANGRYGVILGGGGDILALSGSAGTLSVLGTGGTGTGTGNHGIYLTGSGAAISANGFNVSLNGTGGATATNSHGIQLHDGAVVAATTGAVALLATAASGTGIVGSGTGWTVGGAAASGAIDLVADTMSLGATGAVLRSTGAIALAPQTGGTTIGLGAGSGTLQLADLSFVQAATLNVGSATAGAIDASGVTIANGTDLSLRGDAIALSGNVSVGTANLLSLTAVSGGVTQLAASNISAGSLVLRGQGTFTLARDGSLYNNVEYVAADVTGSLALRTSFGSGQAQIQNETDSFGTVNGIAATNLAWTTTGSFSQAAGATIVVPGSVAIAAGTGTVTLAAAGNDVDGSLSISAASNVAFRNNGATLLGNIAAGSGSVAIEADTGSILQDTGATIVGGAGSFSATAGSINLFNVGNLLTSVALGAGGGGSADFRNAQGFALGASNVSAGLTLQADAGGITQTGTVTTGGKFDLTAVGGIAVQSATVGGAFRALSSAGALTQTTGSIAFTGTGATYAAATGGVTLNTTGNTLLTGLISGGVLNLSVTGGNLTQAANIVTSGATTLTVGNAYQMTLTDSSNVFGSTVTLAGQGGALAGGVSGALLASNAGFTFNGNAVPTTAASTAPVTGGGGTSVSSAISSVAPVEALVSTPAFSAALTQAISAVLSSAVASLTGAGPAAAGDGTNADGSPATPVVVSVAGAAPAAGAPGAPAAGGASGAPAPTIAVSGGGTVTPATAVRTGAGTPIGVSVVFPGLSVNPAPGVTGARAVIRGPIN